MKKQTLRELCQKTHHGKWVMVIPCESLASEMAIGFTEQQVAEWYNPNHYYEKVFCVSPYEKGIREWCGIIVIGCRPYEFRKYTKIIKPDIIRAYGGYEPSGWGVAAKRRGIPLVVSVHDKRPEFIWNELKYADLIIAKSEACRQAIREKIPDINESVIKIRPNVVDESIFKKVDLSKQPDALELGKRFPFRYKILLVGRLSEEKNIDTVIRALKVLGSDYCLIQIGRGDSTEYEQLAVSEGVRDRCFFIESVPHNSLPLWYSFCDVMCTPSRTEGFGNVFIEAAACEAVIVTSNIAPMNEYLTHNQTAYLVDHYEDYHEVADAVKRACEQDAAVHMGRQARACVVARFSKSKVYDLEISYLEKLNLTRNLPAKVYIKEMLLLLWRTLRCIF